MGRSDPHPAGRYVPDSPTSTSVPSIAPSHEPHLQRNAPTRKDDAPDFWYDSGEKALAAAKKAIKGHLDFRYQSSATEDGRLCFEVVEGETVLGRHWVGKPSRTDFAI